MSEEDCYCHTCDRYFHPLGIMMHRAMHRTKGENCTITYGDGSQKTHLFQKIKGAMSISPEKPTELPPVVPPEPPPTGKGGEE